MREVSQNGSLVPSGCSAGRGCGGGGRQMVLENEPQRKPKMAEKGVILRGRHAGWSPLEVAGSIDGGRRHGDRYPGQNKTKKLKGYTGDREGLWFEPDGPLASLCQHSPVPVLLDAVATPLASLPVARVPEGLGSLWDTVEDAKPVPQTGLKIALVHLVSAIPGEMYLMELSPEDTTLPCPTHATTAAAAAHFSSAGQRSLTHRCRTHTSCLPASGTCNSQTCPQRPGAPGRCQS